MSCGRDEERGLPPQLCEEAHAVLIRILAITDLDVQCL